MFVWHAMVGGAHCTVGRPRRALARGPPPSRGRRRPHPHGAWAPDRDHRRAPRPPRRGADTRAGAPAALLGKLDGSGAPVTVALQLWAGPVPFVGAHPCMSGSLRATLPRLHRVISTLQAGVPLVSAPRPRGARGSQAARRPERPALGADGRLFQGSGPFQRAGDGGRGGACCAPLTALGRDDARPTQRARRSALHAWP